MHSSFRQVDQEMSSLHGHGVLADITGVQLTVNAGHTRVTKFLPHNIFLDNANHDCQFFHCKKPRQCVRRTCYASLPGFPYHCIAINDGRSGHLVAGLFNFS